MRKLICAMVVAALMCGCGSADVVVDQGSAGDQIRLTRGQSLVVELAGNPTTGYDWYVESLDESVLSLTSQDFVSESSALGAGGTSTLRFTAVGEGTTQLRLVYERSFEDADPLEEFVVTVVVE
jgi:inhibitor of cysteine peptidase